LNLLGQQRHGELQLVLHLHLRNIRVRGVVERECNRGVPRGLAGRGHVDQAVETLHVLLDDLRHRVLDHFRRGAGVQVLIRTDGGAMFGTSRSAAA
jgi:hypothetical protein